MSDRRRRAVGVTLIRTTIPGQRVERTQECFLAIRREARCLQYQIDERLDRLENLLDSTASPEFSADKLVHLREGIRRVQSASDGLKSNHSDILYTRCQRSRVRGSSSCISSSVMS